jgi:hypothetical protein
MDSKVIHELNSIWTLYYHDKFLNDWSEKSYMKIADFNSIEDFWKIYNCLPEPTETMLFLMRENIKPIWEDPRNKEGGSYSYRINNDVLQQVWTDVSCALIGEGLHKNSEEGLEITGISISPKFRTTTLRVWVSDLEVESEEFVKIENLGDSFFKKH